MNEDPNGRECFIHLVAFDENRQITEGADYFIDAEMVDLKVITGKRAANKPAVIKITDQRLVRAMGSTCRSGKTTDAAQQELHPGDRFFDLVEVIAGSPLSSLPVKTNYGGGGRRSTRGRSGSPPTMRNKNWPRKACHVPGELDTRLSGARLIAACLLQNAVHAMTGKDFAEPFRGKYTTEKGAAKALIKYGHGDIKSTLNAIFGPLKPRFNAGRGDLVLVETNMGDALGVVASGKIWVATLNGLATMPLNRALGCWSVPCHQ